MKHYVKVIVKIVILAVLVFILFQKIDMDKFWAYLLCADAEMLSLAFFALCFQCIILALKWKVLLNKKKFIQLLGGVLTSHVLTYSIGGQLVGEGGKILYLKETGEDMGRIAASVLVDKLTGLLGVFLAGLAGMMLSDNLQSGRYRLIYCIAAGSCSCLILGLFRKHTLRFFGICSEQIRRKAGLRMKIGKKLDDVFQAVSQFADDKKSIACSIVWGIVQQLVSAGSSYMICYAMGIEIGFGELCWIQSLTSVISLIPLSVMGLGAGQVSVVSLMMLSGISGESAAGYSLVLYMLQLGAALLSVIALLFFPGFKRNNRGNAVDD